MMLFFYVSTNLSSQIPLSREQHKLCIIIFLEHMLRHSLDVQYFRDGFFPPTSATL